MSKYDALTAHLLGLPRSAVVLSFDDIDRLVGGLAPSARRHPAWWANSHTSHHHARAWLDTGRSATPDFKRERVTFTAASEIAVVRQDAHGTRVIRPTTGARGPSASLQPVGEDIRETIAFSWLLGGPVQLRGAKLVFPTLPAVGGIYRFTIITAAGRISRYIGESDNLLRRMATYRNPGPTQPTNVRMHAKITEVLLGSGSVELAVVLHATFDDEDLDLTNRPARLLVENAVLVALGREGALVENL